MKTTYGVIVGRFQVNALHEGHMDLFDQVAARHNRIIVFIGCTPAGLTPEHPLDFAVREQMVKAAFPKETYPKLTLIVQPLMDCHDDETWSRQLDEAIDRIVIYADVTLYGGRDSFVPHYTGRFKPVELTLDPRKHIISGTEIRRQFSDQILASPDFRAGMIYAMHQLWPIMLQMVDIAIMNDDLSEVCLGRKPGEKLFRFIGGHAIASKLSLEGNATAEGWEETGLEVDDLEYITSCVIDDWRYRPPDRSVMTAFFLGKARNMGAIAGDDIEEVRWFKVVNLKIGDLVKTHEPLVNALHAYLNKEKSHDNRSRNATDGTMDVGSNAIHTESTASNR